MWLEPTTFTLRVRHAIHCAMLPLQQYIIIYYLKTFARKTDKLLLGLFAQLFFGILNYFSNKVVKKPKKILNTQLKLLVLQRKCRRKVLLPDTNFTNTQLKSSNTQSVLTFKDKYPIPQKLVCFSVLLLKGAHFLYFYFMKLW